MKRIPAGIMIVSIVLSMFAVFTPKAVASENVIFQDNFESYAVGTFPSSGGWQLVYNGAGNQYQVITSDHSASGSRSLQMEGRYSWSAVVAKDFASSSNLIGFEAYLMGTPGSWSSVGFGNEAIQPWGRLYGGVGVDTIDGYIVAGSQNLQPCTANTWYKIREVMDRNAGTFDVWIDDQLKGTNLQEPNNPWGIQSLRFDTGWHSFLSYYDDVQVFEVSGAPAHSSTSVVCSQNTPSTSFTCTATVSGSNPTGTVTWSTSSSTGSFSQNVCSLSSGSCSTTYADISAGTVTITASYSGDSNNAPSSGSTTLTEPEGSGSSVQVVSGSGVFSSVSSSSLTVNVSPGQVLSGTVTLDAVNTWAANDIAPLIGTPTWGDASSSWWLIDSWLPVGSCSRTANVQLTAPSTPGTYYLIFAFRAELTGDQVASGTNWPVGHDVWGDGNDIAEFNTNQINQAQQNGATVDNWLFTGGYMMTIVPADAITLIVGSTARFSPAINGFGFSNYGLLPGCPAYTLNQVIGKLSPELPSQLQNDVGFEVLMFACGLYIQMHYGGHCYGISHASVVYYYSPQSLPPPYAYAGQIMHYDDSPQVFQRIEQGHDSQINIGHCTENAYYYLIGNSPLALEAQIDSIKMELDQGVPVIVDMHGRDSSGREGFHEVVAYDHRIVGTQTWIDFYDSNPTIPGHDRTMKFGTAPGGGLQIIDGGDPVFTWDFVCQCFDSESSEPANTYSALLALEANINSLTDWLRNKLTDVWDMLVQFAKDAPQLFLQFLDWLWNNAKDLYDKLVGLLTGSTSLNIVLGSYANLYVTDPEGRHIGIDPNTQQTIDEISGATFSTSPEQTVSIPNPLAGDYEIEIFGTGTGPYTLTVEGEINGAIVSSSSFTGVSSPGVAQGWTASVSTVAGALVITTTPMKTPLNTYAVTFTESGLPQATMWSVTLNGVTRESSTDTITFAETNGVYSYTVNLINGYTISPSSGTITVNGEDVNQPITFTPLCSVTFTESGLLPGASWSVMLVMQSQSPIPPVFERQGTSAGGDIVFTVPCGTFSYTVDSVAGYDASPSSGTITVYGGNVNQPITFSIAKTQGTPLVGVKNVVTLNDVSIVPNPASLLWTGGWPTPTAPITPPAEESFSIEQNFLVDVPTQSSTSNLYWVQNIIFVEGFYPQGWYAVGITNIYDFTLMSTQLVASHQTLAQNYATLADNPTLGHPFSVPGTYTLTSYISGGQLILSNDFFNYTWSVPTSNGALPQNAYIVSALPSAYLAPELVIVGPPQNTTAVAADVFLSQTSASVQSYVQLEGQSWTSSVDESPINYGSAAAVEKSWGLNWVTSTPNTPDLTAAWWSNNQQGIFFSPADPSIDQASLMSASISVAVPHTHALWPKQPLPI